MAEFNLEVEMTARVGNLEAAFREMQAEADKTAGKMEQSGEAGATGIGKIAVAAAAVAASMAALELATGLAGAAMSLFSGDSEKVRASLSSLPIIGGLITKFYELGDAMEYASQAAQSQREQLLLLEFAAKDAAASIRILRDEIEDMELRAKREGKSELEIAVEVYEKRTELIRKEKFEKLDAIEAEYKARRDALSELNLDAEREFQLFEELRASRHAERRAVTENHERDLEILSKQLGATKKAAEEAEDLRLQTIETEAEAKKKADQEAFKQRMEDEALRLAAQMSGLAKVEQARKEAAKAEKARREEIAENEAAARKKMGEIQKKIDEERASALEAIQGMTGTFDTAGGSFTTGVKAQLDNSKILNKLSEESRDFLAQIVQNTARMVTGVGGFV